MAIYNSSVSIFVLLEKKKNDGSTLIKRTWRTVKRAAGRLIKRNSAAPPRPQPDTDSAHPQPGPSVPEQKESLDLTDLELDPSFFEPPDFLDLTDLLPSFPESPGAPLKESEDPTWLRTISCPGPSPREYLTLFCSSTDCFSMSNSSSDFLSSTLMNLDPISIIFLILCLKKYDC